MAADRPVPFLELLVPFLRVARRRLSDIAPTMADAFSPAAMADLERKLLADLSRISIDAFYSRFDAWRVARGALPPATRSQPERRVYLGFVGQFLAGGFDALLSELPVLARSLALRVELWVETTAELAARALADKEEIAALFAGGARLGTVTRIQPGLSDRHRGGRQVARLWFENGLGVFYKPRPMALEAAFQDLLRALASVGLDPTPPALTVLDRGDYGWMEAATPSGVSDAEAARVYFRRAGALLCLAKVLRADDLHAENVIATERGPVIVDAETLFQPPRADAVSTGLPPVAVSQFLTSPQIDESGRPCDQGGLCGRGGYVTATQGRRWRHVNTDAMAWEPSRETAPESTNRVALGSGFADPLAHRRELADGYSVTYRFLAAQRGQLLGPEGWLRPFHETETRLLLRPSRMYGVALGLLGQARNQRSGAAAGMLIDALQHDLTLAEERPRLWSLLRQERRALAYGDLPVLTVSVTAREITTVDGEPIPGSLTASGYEAVEREIAGLSRGGLEADLAGLDTAFEIAGRVAVSQAPAAGFSADLLAAAVAVGRRLAERAGGLQPAGVSGAWLLPDDARGAPLSTSLYDGAAGITLFLASLGRATGEELFGSLARTALASLVERGESLGSRLGAGNGLGGLLYSLARTSELLGETRWLELAADLVCGLDAGRIDQGPIDLQDGTAGLLAGLLTLSGRVEEGLWLPLARLAASRLAEPVAATGGQGLAHGTAGITMAVGRWASFARDSELAGASAERLARGLEAALSRPELSWCRGASGIGLALSTSPGPAGAERARGAVPRAVARCQTSEHAETDDLCCGQAGRIDFLLTAGEAFGEPDWTASGRAQAAALAAKAGSSRGLALTLGTDAYDPGFFRGLSGIGYLFLRAAQPGAFPSVAALSPGRGGAAC